MLTKDNLYKILLFSIILSIPGRGYIFPIDLGFISIYAFRWLVFISMVVLFVNKDMVISIGKYSKWLFYFLIIWIIYALLSLFWVIDYMSAFKDIFYLFTTVASFIVVISFVKYFKNESLKIICNAWMLGFALTGIIAIFEMYTGQHLESSYAEKVYSLSHNHPAHFIPVITFDNPNLYACYLILSIPVITLYYFIISRFWGTVALVFSAWMLYETSSRLCQAAFVVQAITILSIVCYRLAKDGAIIFSWKWLLLPLAIFLYFFSINLSTRIVAPIVTNSKEKIAELKTNEQEVTYRKMLAKAEDIYAGGELQKSYKLFKEIYTKYPNKKYAAQKYFDLQELLADSAKLLKQLNNSEVDCKAVMLTLESKIQDYEQKLIEEQRKVSIAEKKFSDEINMKKNKSFIDTKKNKSNKVVNTNNTSNKTSEANNNNNNNLITFSDSVNSEKKQNTEIKKNNEANNSNPIVEHEKSINYEAKKDSDITKIVNKNNENNSKDKQASFLSNQTKKTENKIVVNKYEVSEKGNENKTVSNPLNIKNNNSEPLTYSSKNKNDSIIQLINTDSLKYIAANDRITSDTTTKVLSKAEIDEQGSIGMRINLLLSGLQFLKETYFMGVGAGNYTPYMQAGKSKHPTKMVNPHNWLIEILSQYGIIIFSLFIFLMLNILWNMIKTIKNNLLSNYHFVSFLVGLSLLSGYVFASSANSSFMAPIESSIFLIFIALAADSYSGSNNN